jgi:two-component system cell cycle response regulator
VSRPARPRGLQFGRARAYTTVGQALGAPARVQDGSSSRPAAEPAKSFMKILVADDDQTSRHLLTRTLEKWGYEVVTVTNGGDAAYILLKEKNAPRIAVLDWMMPELDGLEVCRMVRSAPNAPFVYLILLSGKGEKRDAIAGLEAGADDYLVKPFDAQELRYRIRVGERIISLESELRKANEELQRLASTDVLTGIMNRRSILERLDEELARSLREKSSLTVVVADLDYFKKINDTYGHPAGDEVLREFTRRVKRHIRPYDEIGRYGGEEFLILMPGLKKNGFHAAVDRLRRKVSGTSFRYENKEFTLTVSFGVCWLPPGQGCTPEQIISLADDMLYRAKQEGRDRVVSAVFAPTVESRTGNAQDSFVL